MNAANVRSRRCRQCSAYTRGQDLHKASELRRTLSPSGEEEAGLQRAASNQQHGTKKKKSELCCGPTALRA